MKKNLLAVVSGALGMLAFAMPAFAETTLSFSPASVSVRQGQTITFSVFINPHGIKNYTDKVELSFPADLFEARSFTFGSGWMPLSQPGYDLTDNTAGLLIKTAGYPGGLSAATSFGTVSFRAKKTGTGVIRVRSTSVALDATNQNVLSAILPSAVVTITAAAVVPTAPTVPTQKPATPREPVAPVEPAPVGTTQPQPQQPISESPAASTSLLGAVGSILTLGTGNAWVGILTLVVILLIVFYGYSFWRRRTDGSR